MPRGGERTNVLRFIVNLRLNEFNFTSLRQQRSDAAKMPPNLTPEQDHTLHLPSHTNSCHATNVRTYKDYRRLPKQSIQDELKRRGLPHIGLKNDLMKSFKLHNELLCTLKGQYEVHLKKLQDFKQANLDAIVPIQQYIPPEIRSMIWRYALPGPRVLVPSDVRRYVDKFHFRKKDNPENPALLYVSRETRNVARERYHLVFGTTNVYADLSCDTLYFNSRWYNLSGLLGDYSSIFTGYKVAHGWNHTSPKLLSDLEEVVNLALPRGCWETYASTSHNSTRNGGVLRSHADKIFRGLQHLMLVQEDTDDGPYRFQFTPGHIELKKTSQTKHCRSIWPYFASKPGFLRAVEANRITDILGENWAHSIGDPYYPQIEASTDDAAQSERKMKDNESSL
ncbi:uncharacterized protein LY89DRAFT_685960, partial [Mollisia scopiformis]